MVQLSIMDRIQKIINRGTQVVGCALAILLLWTVALPYIQCLIFMRDYKSTAIHVPATGETFYLISYSTAPIFDDKMYCIELSTNNLRFFNEKDYEFSYPPYGEGLSFSKLTFYYKVSNDTLYLDVYTAVEEPKQWRAKTKIIQYEDCHFITKEGIHGYRAIDEKERPKKWESLGFTKFP